MSIRIFYAFMTDNKEVCEDLDWHAYMDEPENFWRGYCEEQEVCQKFVNENVETVIDSDTGKVFRPVVQHWMKWR